MVYAQNVLALVGEEHEGIIIGRLKHMQLWWINSLLSKVEYNNFMKATKFSASGFKHERDVYYVGILVNWNVLV